jgi:hypothetical protein
MVPTDCPITLANNYQSMLPNNPEEQTSNLYQKSKHLIYTRRANISFTPQLKPEIRHPETLLHAQTGLRFTPVLHSFMASI